MKEDKKEKSMYYYRTQTNLIVTAYQQLVNGEGGGKEGITRKEKRQLLG